jgi:hypothetical protein
MNQIYRLRNAQMSCPARVQHDPLDTFTGLLWSSLLGGTFWLVVIALALNR